MNLVLTKYYYDNAIVHARQEVRVYSEEQGANGRVVLEDIISVLLTDNIPISKPHTREKSTNTSNILALTKEKIEIADINPVVYEGLHLADIEQLNEFYHFCNDLSQTEAYKSFGNWLNFQICSLMIKRLVHLGNLVNQLPFWEEYTLRISKLFGKKEKVTIAEWLNKAYGLTVPWIITILIYKIKILMIGVFKVNARELPEKNQANTNLYSLNTFGFVAQGIEWLLAGQDNWSWLKESLDHDFVKQAIDADKNLVESLRQDGKNDNEIIQIIWMVTSTSNIVENNNYQYEILKAFLEMV